MSIEDKFGFIGWNCEGTSDKIWGYFYRPTPAAAADRWIDKNHGWNCCKFWGRRGKAMQFQQDVTGYELTRLVDTKVNKGYVRINQDKLFKIWPTFIQEAEAKLMWEILAGKVK